MKCQAGWSSRWNQDNFRYAYKITLTNSRKQRGTKETLDEGERGRWKSWLKTQHSKNEDHGIQSHHFMAKWWINTGNIKWQTLFYWVPTSMCTVTEAMKLKEACFLEEKIWQTSVQFSRSIVSDYLWPHELQHARAPCPSPTPGVHSNSRPSSQWCHPAISTSVVPFSSCPQSLPASGSFPMSQLFTWGSQSIGVSALDHFFHRTPSIDLL